MSTWVFLVKTGLFVVPVALAAAGLTPMDLLARESPTAPGLVRTFGGLSPRPFPARLCCDPPLFPLSQVAGTIAGGGTFTYTNPSASSDNL